MSQINLSRWMLISALQPVQIAFSHAVDAVEARLRKAQADLVAHEKFVAEGGDDEVELDEENNIIASKTHQMEFEVYDASESVRAIRESCIISIFHLWERAARGWVEYDGQGFDNLVKELRRASITVDPLMMTMNNLVVFLKHGYRNNQKDNIHRKLKKYLPDAPFITRIIILDCHIVEFINAVKASSPPPPPQMPI